MKRVILVTNPEPTSHASAGAYAKEVQRLFPGTPLRFWHNRYSVRTQQGFNPRDVAGNYNRFVSDSERLTQAEMAFLHDFAFVPEDPALDLLQGEPNPVVHVLKCMRDSLDYAHGRLLFQASGNWASRRGYRRSSHTTSIATRRSTKPMSILRNWASI